MPSPSLSAAARHGETLFAQSPSNECSQHFFHVAADAGDYPNPTVGQTRFQRLRDAGANQRPDAEFRQVLRSFVSRVPFDKPLLSGNLSTVGQFDQQELPGNVKDWRNAALPNWNGESHGLP